MSTTHVRAKRELRINRDCCCNRNRFDDVKFFWIDISVAERSPEVGRNDSNHNNQAKEGLRETGVKDSDLIFQHGDAEAAENYLQNHSRNRTQTKRIDRCAIDTSPQ